MERSQGRMWMEGRQEVLGTRDGRGIVAGRGFGLGET